MALEITCLNVSLSLPTIPIINNMTIVPSHSYYNPNGKAISQLISSSLARSTFSTADIRSFLNMLTSDGSKSWDASTVVGLKPVTSTIIYLSVTLTLFIVLAFIFYIISCCNCCKRDPTANYKQMRKRKCSGKCVCIVLIVLVGLLVIGQMIYIAYQVSRTTTFLDDSIKEINQEIYPKEVSFHLKHLLQQLKSLDQYSTQTDSIVIKASRALLIKAFDQILRQQYYFDEIRQSVAESEAHINALNELIDEETSLFPGTILLFEEIKREHQNMIEYLKIPLRELCDYADGSEMEIDNTILDALDPIHQQLEKLIDTIEKDFLSDAASWQNTLLINENLEGQIHRYVRLVGTILLVLIIIFGLIPIFFFIIIILCRCCRGQRKDSSSNDCNRENRWIRPSQSSTEDNESSSSLDSSNRSSNVALCCMRIIFIPMAIMLVVIVLLTGVLYAVDLFAQGACRTVHDDQAFLVPFLIDELLGPNSSSLIVGGYDIETTATAIINDCGNQIHFSEYFFENLLDRLQTDVDQAMNQLNKKINDKFIDSIVFIDITSDLDRLEKFSIAANSTKIQAEVKQISQDLNTIAMQFEKISASMPTLPTNLVNQTFDDLQSYVKIVLKSTIDTCPLPLAIIYKADILVCHKFATSINGLWFSLFIYMLFIIFGLCICGLCIYKRL